MAKTGHHTVQRGWAILSLAALALAGLALIVPALSKVPGLDTAVAWPPAFFQKGLVAHVALSFIVWFLAVLSLIALSGPRAPDRRDSVAPGAVGLVLATMGTLAIAGAPLLHEAEASLNNYIPSILHPLYFAGLALVALGTLICVVMMLLRLARPSPAAPSERAFLLALGLLYIAALVAVALAAAQLREWPDSYDAVERLFWGGGHILQFVNLGLLLVSLDRLGRGLLGAAPMGETASQAAAGLLFLGGVGGLTLYSFTDIHTDTHIAAFTELQYALGVPVLIAAGGALTNLRRWRTAVPGKLERTSLISAVLVFAVGLVLGLFVDGFDTRTPAHYHALIGGINLAFYGLFYTRILPALGRPLRREGLAFTQMIVYAIGQTSFVAGLFIAGGMGAPRKTMGAGIAPDSIGAKIVLAMRDFGVAVALVAAAGFVIGALIVLLRREKV